MSTAYDSDENIAVVYERSVSPDERVIYHSDVDDIVSPQKKTKVYRDRAFKPRGQRSQRTDSGNNNVPDLDTSEPESQPLPIDPRLFTLATDSPLLSIDTNLSYQSFVNSLDWDDTMFTPISSSNRVFVVHGWHVAKMEATTARYHLSRTQAGEGTSVMCDCPIWRLDNPCVHERYLLEYGDREYPIGPMSENDSLPLLISRTETAVDDTYVNIFTVASPAVRFHTIRARAIVEHVGLDNGDGVWSCSKDSKVISCIHISEARNYLRRVLTGDLEAMDEAATSTLQYDPDLHSSRQGRGAAPPAVSDQPRPPPAWARIRSDSDLGLDIPILASMPTLIKMDVHATCCCQEERATFDPDKEIVVKPCIIYTLTGAWECQIETQRCPLCPYRLIGPDCRDLGIFNFNNRALYTHELLDDYTSAYTASETPFAAWVLNISRRYVARQSKDFVKEKNFIAVWFSYMSLVRLDDDMHCSICGTSPKVTIWDGVTLAFNRKHVLKTLRPPTTVTDASPVKDKVKPQGSLQCIPDKPLRRDIRFVLDGPPLEIPDPQQFAAPVMDAGLSSEAKSAILKNHEAKKERGRAMLSRLEMIPSVKSRLQEIDKGVSAVFEREFGLVAISSRRPHRHLYANLFRQIAAEENALQLLNNSAQWSLKNFLKNPSPMTASTLVLIPALHAVINIEMSAEGNVSQDTLALARWLFTKGYSALTSLRKYGLPPNDTLAPEDLPWQETGSFYSMPPIRTRPIYTAFPNDSGRDSAKKEMRGEGCNKFYAKYGESRLTGGIMVVWCSHSICYGFHCIPAAEGRNDVFSAVYTRWETAPSMLVYDFACALQPYCMAREPEFFANTLFVIDSFHSGGHTKCGHAAFLDTYCVTNPLLLSVNSSAAECGNGGLSRIRKSVIYMSQARAIMYTKIFLSIWNRARIQALERAK